MADHALEAARYAIRAVRMLERTHDLRSDDERTWQLERIPEEISPLIVISAADTRMLV